MRIMRIIRIMHTNRIIHTMCKAAPGLLEEDNDDQIDEEGDADDEKEDVAPAIIELPPQPTHEAPEGGAT